MSVYRLFPDVRRRRPRLHAGTAGKLPLTFREAASVRAELTARRAAPCPRCRNILHATLETVSERHHWVVSCPECESTHRVAIRAVRPGTPPALSIPNQPRSPRWSWAAAACAIAAHATVLGAISVLAAQPDGQNRAPVARYADTTFIALAPPAMTSPSVNESQTNPGAPERAAKRQEESDPASLAPRRRVVPTALGSPLSIRRPSGIPLATRPRSSGHDGERIARRGSVGGSEATTLPGTSEYVYTEEAVDRRPERLSGPRPSYPAALREEGIQGSVILRFIIDTDGRVEPLSLTVLAATRLEFMLAAVEAVKRSRYQPGAIDGEPVRVLVQQNFTFALAEDLDPL